jgi:hypothetical protein
MINDNININRRSYNYDDDSLSDTDSDNDSDNDLKRRKVKTNYTSDLQVGNQNIDLVKPDTMVNLYLKETIGGIARKMIEAEEDVELANEMIIKGINHVITIANYNYFYL